MLPEIWCTTDGQDGQMEKVTYRGGYPTQKIKMPEAYSEPSQKSRMDDFANLVYS